jgi:hypothetical protein
MKQNAEERRMYRATAKMINISPAMITNWRENTIFDLSLA